MNNNDQEEHDQLVNFFQIQGISFVDYTLHPDGINNAPDACFQKDGKRISVEHTRLINEQIKEKSSIIQCIFCETKKLLPNWNEFHIDILFKNYSSLSIKNAYKLAEEIKNAIARHLPLNSAMKETICSNNVIIYAKRIIGSELGRWRFPNTSCGWVDSSNNLLQRIIRKKEDRLERYSKNYDEHWLFIHIDRYKSHGMFEVSQQKSISTTFHRVFILSGNDLIEITSRQQTSN